MQKEENDEEENDKKYDIDNCIWGISENNEKMDINIEEIVSNLFQSFDESKKEDCIRALSELYICITCDDENIETDIEKYIIENEFFIEYIKKIVSIDDNETFQLCSLLVYSLTNSYSSFCKSLFESGLISFYLEKLKEIDPNNSLLFFQIFYNVSKNCADALNFLIFSDIFDILLLMLDQDDIDMTKNPIAFLKSFLELIIDNEDYKELISNFIQKIYDIMKRSVAEENEIMLSLCLCFLSEYINSSFLEDIVSFLSTNLASFPLQCSNLTMSFFLQLLENHLLTPILTSQMDIELFYHFIYNTKEFDELVLNSIFFLTELTKFQGEIVQKVFEHFQIEMFMELIQSKPMKLKVAGAQFICSMIVNLESNESISLFVNDELIDFLREIDKIERNKSSSININGAFTRLFMVIIDEDNPLKDVLSKYIF